MATEYINYSSVSPSSYHGMGLMSTSKPSEYTISDGITQAPYERPFSDTGVVISATILLVFLVFGVLTNVLTIVVIVYYPTLRNNLFVRFLLSLCCSDLISALISWLFLHRRTWGFDNWDPVPPIFCKFYWAADTMTSFATALHIFAFAILRFVSIKFPVAFKHMTLLKTQIVVGCLWIASFIAGFIPIFVWFEAGETDRFSGLPNARWPACTLNIIYLQHYLNFQKIGYSLFLYVPAIGVIIFTALIVHTVRSRSTVSNENNTAQKKRKRKEHQATVQLLLIAALFLFGYVPFTAYELWSSRSWPNTPYYRQFDYWFGMVEYICLRFSECLNPVFYNLGSAKMRKHTIRFIREKIFCCYSTENSSRSVTSRSSTADPTAVSAV